MRGDVLRRSRVASIQGSAGIEREGADRTVAQSFSSEDQDKTNVLLVAAVLASAFVQQIVTSIMRVTTTYRAVELDLSVVWIGLIAGLFAFLPIFLALPIGRYIDRGHYERANLIGSVMLLVSCIGLVLWPTLPGILLFTAFGGIGHLYLLLSQQVLCTRCGSRKTSVETVVGNYMVANALGQGVGPYILGWVGGSATVPPTQLLFNITAAGAVLLVLIALVIRPGKVDQKPVEVPVPLPVLDILRIAGLGAILLVSIVAAVAQDLVVIYLPLLGTERGWSVNDVGSLLAVRAIASVGARLFFSRLAMMVSQPKLMLYSTLLAALSYAALAFPLSLAMTYVVIAVSGCSLGIALTCSIASSLRLAAGRGVGTANSLRMLGNRIGQFSIPFLASLVAAAAGVTAIFFIIGVTLMSAAGALKWRGSDNA
jgi:hypothetical protein